MHKRTIIKIFALITLLISGCNKKEQPLITNGDFQQKETVFSSTKDNSFSTLNNRHLETGTFESDLLYKEGAFAGLLFNVSKDYSSYYYFGINNNELYNATLIKCENGIEKEITSCYIHPENEFKLKVIFNKNDIKCFCKDRLVIYHIDDQYLQGSLIGLKSNISGVSFCNLQFNNNIAFQTHDVLLVGHSYMDLWKNYKEDLNKYNDVFNLAINGSATLDWICHSEEIIAYKPKKVIICIGINDFSVNTQPYQSYSFLRMLVDVLLEQLQNTHFCILSLNKQCLLPNYDARIDQLNAYYKQYCAESPRLHYGNLDNAFLDVNGNPDPSYFTDGLHPSEESYKIIANAIYEAFGD